jgi:hypothetical protein
MMMNRKIEILFISLLLLTFYKCSNVKDEILVSKVVVEKEYCENCIGINRIKIKYIAKTNFKIEGILISNKDKSSFKVYKYKKDMFGKYLYELVYDEISLSKFYTLNDAKKKYNGIIYFKKIDFVNSKRVMKKANEAKICYILNGKEIRETDVEMNYPVLPKLVSEPNQSDLSR